MAKSSNNFEKQYSTGDIQYQYRREFKKWEFKSPAIHLLTPVRGGSENAHKIAGLVKGALTRTGGKSLDAMARGAINKINGLTVLRRNFARI